MADTSDSDEWVVPAETAALVQQGIAETMKARAKITLGDLFQRVLNPSPPAVPDKTPPLPRSLTEAEQQALKRLPEVFGQTVVLRDRPLTQPELAALVEERGIIDTLLGPLKQRKDESIREVFANHADHLIPPDEAATMRKDAKGHLAPFETQEIPVPGTGMKVQRYASGGKPQLTIEDIEDLYAEGVIDRRTYLRCTKRPDTPRVLDLDGLHRAIQKDPRLFFVLGSRAKPSTPTTTIKVVPDK